MITKTLDKILLTTTAIGLAGALLIALPSASNAQETAQAQTGEGQASQNTTAESSSQVQEVVVTARLRKESLMQTPVQVVAVSGANMAAQGVNDLMGLNQLVPTVELSPYFHADAIHIRGIGTSSLNSGFEQQASIFIDGVYYGTGHWIYGAYVDLDQVQVLEGPQGVYFGKNTIAGAIQLTTNNPTDVFEGYLKAGYEINAQERYVQGMLNVPIDDKLGVRLAVRSTGMEGWGKSPEGTSQPGTSETYARMTIGWKPTDNIDVTLKGSIDDYHDNGPTATTTILNCPAGQPTPLSLWALFGVPGSGGHAECARNYNFSTGEYTSLGRSFDDNPSYTVTLNANYHDEYGTLTSITGLNRFALATLGQYGGTSYDGIDGLNGTRNQTVSTELRYQTKLDFPVNFLVGVYYQSSAFFDYEEPDIIPVSAQGQPFTWTRGSRQDGESKAAFGEVQWTPIPEVEIDAGGRFTDETKNFYFNQFNTAPIAQAFGIASNGVVQGASANYNFSPQFTATWRPIKDLMAYMAFKTGFLAGGFEHTATLSPSFPASQFKYGPEKVQGGEIGTKLFLFDRSVQLTGTAYYYDYTGLQVTTYNPSTTTFYVQNAGESIDKGIEVSGIWKIGDGFQLNGEVNYNKSYFAQFVGSCLANVTTIAAGCNVPTTTPGVYEQDFTGTHTDYAPTWVGRIALSWTGDVAEDTTLHAGFGVDLTDKYLEDQFASQSGFVKVDANVSVTHGPWEVAFIGQNLTNQFVCGTTFGRPLASNPAELECTVDRGLQLRTEATYHFGGAYDVPEAPAAAPPPPVAAPAPPPPAAPAPAPEAKRAFQVFFDFDKSAITADAAAVLQQAAASIKAGNNVRVLVTGHTDTVGSVRYNQKLSERRAAAVKLQLVSDGISAEEIETKGVGKSDLLVPTPDGVREPQNRRAEIVEKQPGA